MKRERVAIAMSGGVDSSVAAALLVERGYEVVGFTMQIWPRGSTAEMPPELHGCCGLDALDSARRAARDLRIRHYVLDLREPFQRLVIDPFCDEYVRGRTPNPCIRCNTFVKFGALLHRARQIDATHLATGHYARVRYDEQSGRWALLTGVDRAKDQSYSLYGLSQEHLARALFPLGEMNKSDTRARAADLGLEVAERPDSQEICFVSDAGYKEYLRRRRPEAARRGPIVDRAGRQIGMHEGIAFYTIGQRQGLGISHSTPLYVTGVDAERNRLIVGDESQLQAHGLLTRDANYVSVAELPGGGIRLAAKIRYGAAAVECRAYPVGRGVRLTFAAPQSAVTPGQAAVCYEGEAVALGGTIETAV
jgi:tRNA-specific 2-thiouridylase